MRKITKMSIFNILAITIVFSMLIVPVNTFASSQSKETGCEAGHYQGEFKIGSTIVGETYFSPAGSDSDELYVENDLLEDGEYMIGNSIVGKTMVSPANDIVLRGPHPSLVPNYFYSEEIYNLGYKGYIQFQASYEVQDGDGYGLVPGRHVKQAWLDYRRQGESVIDGIKWTEVADSIFDDNVYSTSASCMDDLIHWGEAGRTYFYRGWKYFD